MDSGIVVDSRMKSHGCEINHSIKELEGKNDGMMDIIYFSLTLKEYRNGITGSDKRFIYP